MAKVNKVFETANKKGNIFSKKVFSPTVIYIIMIFNRL
jgi:hypothetical protein